MWNRPRPAFTSHQSKWSSRISHSRPPHPARSPAPSTHTQHPAATHRDGHMRRLLSQLLQLLPLQQVPAGVQPLLQLSLALTDVPSLAAAAAAAALPALRRAAAAGAAAVPASLMSSAPITSPWVCACRGRQVGGEHLGHVQEAGAGQRAGAFDDCARSQALTRTAVQTKAERPGLQPGVSRALGSVGNAEVWARTRATPTPMLTLSAPRFIAVALRISKCGLSCLQVTRHTCGAGARLCVWRDGGQGVCMVMLCRLNSLRLCHSMLCVQRRSWRQRMNRWWKSKGSK